MLIFCFQGCYDELVHYIQDHAIVIGISSIAAVVLMVSRILSQNGLVHSLYLFIMVSRILSLNGLVQSLDCFLYISHNLQLDVTVS